MKTLIIIIFELLFISLSINNTCENASWINLVSGAQIF